MMLTSARIVTLQNLMWEFYLFEFNNIPEKFHIEKTTSSPGLPFSFYFNQTWKEKRSPGDDVDWKESMFQMFVSNSSRTVRVHLEELDSGNEMGNAIIYCWVSWSHFPGKNRVKLNRNLSHLVEQCSYFTKQCFFSFLL